MDINTVGIVGTVAEAPVRFKDIFGQSNVYAMWLDSKRLSETSDRILVLFQEDKIEGEEFKERLLNAWENGCKVEVTGSLQTYKTKAGRTQVFVWGLYIAEVPGYTEDMNAAYLKGEVAKQPKYRDTPKGRRLTEVILKVPSFFNEGYYSYIPCITWGPAADRAVWLKKGDMVYLEGRTQKREYAKPMQNGYKMMATWEVSVSKLAEVAAEQENGDN